MLKCDHCLLDFPEKYAVYGDIKGQKRTFCCTGCHGIYTLIQSEGLDDFYEKRKWGEAGSPAASIREIDIKPFTDLVRDAGDRKEMDIFIDGIRCSSCIWLNEKFLGRVNGVEYIRINYVTHRARIRWDPGKVRIDEILKRILSIGYKPKPYSESEQYKARKAETRDLMIRFGTAAFLSSQLMMFTIALYAGYFQGMQTGVKHILEIISLLLTTPVLFFSGMPFIKNTLTGLRRLHFTMDSLITLGAGSAFVYSIYQMWEGGTVYFDTSAMIVTLILLGRYIEAVVKGQATDSIERLRELSPKEARAVVRRDGNGDILRQMVPLVSVKKGDLVEVIPGERIPLDGIVLTGESEADESLLTGESKPLPKKPGTEVVGGSINLFGTFIFEVTKTGKDTVLAGIIRAVEDAQARKPDIQILADRIVGYFVPSILLIALATVAGYLLKGSPAHRSLMAGISVLVIACPCSLGLATPLAVLKFTSMASAKGILVRRGDVIENACRITHVLFDKTGTVTTGKPSLKEVVIIDPDEDRGELIALAASVENLSEHSIGHALTSAADRKLLPVSDFRAIPGKGVEGRVDGKWITLGNRAFMKERNAEPGVFDEAVRRNEKDGVVYMSWDGKVRAIFIVSDVIRNEAPEVVEELRKMSKDVLVVSGDNKFTTAAIASSIGIEQSVSESSPEKKREVVAAIQKKGGSVMMVGDGINDAPALTEALVGVAMGRGTDIAMESADAVLVRDDLHLVPWFISFSRKAYGIIRENIFWAFFYNVVAVPLAISGALHPIIAAGAMAASSLMVVLNSLRIRKA
jgi:Cu2+-exporting ATPase